MGALAERLVRLEGAAESRGKRMADMEDYLDSLLLRFLMADVTNISRQKLQLVGVAAMLIAAK